jgi:uncharacterized protein (UPF0332 family)
LRQGAYIVEATGRCLQDLEHQVCADRLELSSGFADAGDRLLRLRGPEYRSAISRYYYSMYHSMRAVVFFVNRGDDHEQHNVLPRHTPNDFPNAPTWENCLKDARARRNDADYDPYPTDRSALRAISYGLKHEARSLHAEAVAYLKSKGCQFL